MFNSTKISELQAEITRLTHEGNGFKTERDDLKTQLAEAMTKAGKVEGLESQITALTTEKTELTTKLTTATGEITKLKADFDARVETAVVERCAAAGVVPIARDPESAEGGAESFDEKLKAAKAIENPTQRAKAIQVLFDAQK
jgi:seryl-tRNA synthetase